MLVASLLAALLITIIMICLSSRD
jgi:O-acetyl-ADP-ribose deacetylase (regulator of RNase III)